MHPNENDSRLYDHDAARNDLDAARERVRCADDAVDEAIVRVLAAGRCVGPAQIVALREAHEERRAAERALIDAIRLAPLTLLDAIRLATAITSGERP